MAITSYAQLQTDIQTIIDTSDPEVTALIPFAIERCEERMNNLLRVQQMSGRFCATVETEYQCFPNDFLGLRRIHSEYNGKSYTLEYLNPENITNYKGSIETGRPIYAYSIVGNDLQFTPKPTVLNPIEVDIAYWARIPALTDSNTTNWVLDNYSHMYMAGTLAEMFLIMFDEGRAGLYESRFTTYVDDLKDADKRKRASGNSLAVKTR